MTKRKFLVFDIYLMGNNPSYFTKCGDNCPVENVSWKNTHQFLNKLNQTDSDYQYRLPTELEWSYAWHAGKPKDYFADLDSIGWYENNSGQMTHVVGQLRANDWGLFDMLGNVNEWCEDWSHNIYEAPNVGRESTSGEQKHRVARGGAWQSNPISLRQRWISSGADPDGSPIIGFRVVATLQPK
jgi:formylglycine-generating enzyme required for sulfatase activity